MGTSNPQAFWLARTDTSLTVAAQPRIRTGVSLRGYATAILAGIYRLWSGLHQT